MWQENVKVVQIWVHSFVEDTDAFRSILHPEIEWFPFEDNHSPSYGIDGAMRIRNHWLESWNEIQAEVEQIVERGDDVLASLHVTGQGKTSGITVDVRLHLHFKLRDGKIVYLFEHQDRAEALEAVGLSEQDAHANS